MRFQNEYADKYKANDSKNETNGSKNVDLKIAADDDDEHMMDLILQQNEMM